MYIYLFGQGHRPWPAPCDYLDLDFSDPGRANISASIPMAVFEVWDKRMRYDSPIFNVG